MRDDIEQNNFLETLSTAEVSQQISHVYISYFCVLKPAIMITGHLLERNNKTLVSCFRGLWKGHPRYFIVSTFC